MENKNDIQIAINKIMELIYEMYLKDMKEGYIKRGNYKDEILNKQVVEKSAQKARTFQQPALKFK